MMMSCNVAMWKFLVSVLDYAPVVSWGEGEGEITL